MSLTTVQPGMLQQLASSNMPTGSVLQVVQVVNSTTYSSSSTTYVTPTGMSATITPKFSTSKILVLGKMSCSGSLVNIITFYSQLVRGSTPLDGPSTSSTSDYAFVNERFINYLDSPATTSPTTYAVQFKGDGATWQINRSGNSTNATQSQITLMEIAG